MDKTVQNLQRCASELAEGMPVICLLRNDSGNVRGLYIMSAEQASEKGINMLAKHGRGVISAGITRAVAEKLQLRPMEHGFHMSQHNTQATVSIDARHGIHTGISAKDRAITLRLLGSSQATINDFVQPGHIFPYVAHSHGVLGRMGAPEVASDMAHFAGQTPVGVFCTILDAQGRVADEQYVRNAARKLNIPLFHSADLQAYRLIHEPFIQQVRREKPTPNSELTTYKDRLHNEEHFILQNRCEKLPNPRIHLYRAQPANDLFFSATPNAASAFQTLRQKVLDTGGVLVYIGKSVPRGRHTQAVIVQLLRDVGIHGAAWDWHEVELPRSDIPMVKASTASHREVDLKNNSVSPVKTMAKM